MDHHAVSGAAYGNTDDLNILCVGKSHDCEHRAHGTTTLFAALDIANGEVYGLCQQKHAIRNG
jgi:hypothetical protein